jgi:hypothetical protein
MGLQFPTNATERFFTKVVHAGPCWLWTAARSGNGYGVFSPTKTTKMAAHRFADQALIGEIPSGLDLDHLCRVRDCVNPTHLEPVTRAENLRRSELTGPGRNFAKTHCLNGHPLSEAYVYTDKRGVTHRFCVACRTKRYREWAEGVCPKCSKFYKMLPRHLKEGACRE